MQNLTTVTDNAKQVEYWNGRAGIVWREQQETLDLMLAPLTGFLLDRMQPVDGRLVVDIGCGCGTTSLHLAAAGANVIGIDISVPMLTLAQERAARHPQGERISFVREDASNWPCQDVGADWLCSRFGVMFFAAPDRAFANLRLALHENGRMVFLCWRAVQENPWMSKPMRAMLALLPDPPPRPDPYAPGPFALADPDYLRAQLAAAGFADVSLHELDAEIPLGEDGSIAGAVDFIQHLGAFRDMLQDLSDAPLIEDIRAAIAAELAPYAGTDGVLLPAACWLVQARR